MGQLKGDYSAWLTPVQDSAIEPVMQKAFSTAKQVSGGWTSAAMPNNVESFSGTLSEDQGKSNIAAYTGYTLIEMIENALWSRADIGSDAWTTALMAFYGLNLNGSPNHAGPNDYLADVIVNVFGGIPPTVKF